MSIAKAYNAWSEKYDTVENKTRDLDKIATQQTLSKYTFDTVLELGCGTGKNTTWLLERAPVVIGVDFSEGMLAQARAKIKAANVQFLQADLTKPWPIDNDFADLITCSLILEHIADLGFIFQQAYDKLKNGGRFFICELHPFKQYKGSKARFETETGVQELEVYIHHVSEFVATALNHGFKLAELKEWFDEDQPEEIPRLLSLVFEK